MTTPLKVLFIGVLALGLGACSNDGSGGSKSVQPDDVSDLDATGRRSDVPSATDTQKSGPDLSHVPKADCKEDNLPLSCPVSETQSECFPADTDCTTVHKNPRGNYVGCKNGDTGHVDGTGHLQCCSDFLKVWCDADGDYVGGCHPEGSECSTLKQCGEMWQLCPEGTVSHCGAGEIHCCSGDISGFCAPTATHNGFCAAPDANCVDAVSCDGKNFVTCKEGQTPHCDSNKLHCCGAEEPQYCPKGSGRFSSFFGGCFASDANCDSAAPQDGKWITCKKGQEWGIDVDGNLVCCSDDKPKYCENYSDANQSYQGKLCFEAGTNCSSLTKSKDGESWKYCKDGEEFGVDITAALNCCTGDTPTWCKLGIEVLDGDKAYAYSISKKTKLVNCTNQCVTDADCSGSSPPLKCKTLGNGKCNQCVASPQGFTGIYEGGCWPKGQDCTAMYVCGKKTYPCPSKNCWCWEGVLYQDW